MSNDNNRTDQSPSDPQYGWRGVNTDMRARPTPNRLDEMRRCIPGHVETAVRPQADETAALSYSAGISLELARRIVALERALEHPLLLSTVTDLVNGYGELTVQLAELRQAIAALQAKKK